MREQVFSHRSHVFFIKSLYKYLKIFLHFTKNRNVWGTRFDS